MLGGSPGPWKSSVQRAACSVQRAAQRAACSLCYRYIEVLSPTSPRRRVRVVRYQLEPRLLAAAPALLGLAGSLLDTGLAVPLLVQVPGKVCRNKPFPERSITRFFLGLIVYFKGSQEHKEHIFLNNLFSKLLEVFHRKLGFRLY